MPSRDHTGVALRRPASRRILALLIACLAALGLAAPAVAAERAPIDAARDALRLTERRLSLMDQVMVTKWLNRSPIEDRAQEQVVLDGAVALTRPRGLADAGVQAFFTQQITAAKEVQQGWGDEWLYLGFPAGRTAPDLAALRAELAGLNPQLVDALAELGSLRCEAGARAQLMADASELIRTRFVTGERRAAIVDALLSVRRDGATDCTPRLPVDAAHGVRIVRRGRESAFVFTRQANRLWRQIAGRPIEISCVDLGRPGSAGFEEGAFGQALRAPRARRPIPLGNSRSDYCGIALRHESDRSASLDTLVRIPITQAGAVALDEREKAESLMTVISMAGVLAERTGGFATPAQMTRGAIARYLRLERAPRVVALAAESDTPVPGRIGYWSDGRQRVVAVALSAAGRRLYVELAPDETLRMNVARPLFSVDG